jgi:regulatory protein
MPATRQSATEFGIAVISARSLPEKKVRERIAARFSPEETDAAVARLRELRYVDDAAWAERYARDRFSRAGKGRHKIRAELATRGIDRATAEAAIEAAIGEDDERARASAALEAMRAKLASGSASPSEHTDRTLKDRLFRRMLARGYPASLVRDLLGVS